MPPIQATLPEKEPEKINKPESSVRHTDNFNLHRFSYIGDLGKVKHVLETTKADIHSKDKKGLSALMNAAFKNREDVVEYLIRQGADCHVLSPSRRNLLSYAVQNKNKDLVQKFLSLNVLPRRYNNGKDTLYDAVNFYDLPVLTLILAHSPEVNTAYMIKPDDAHYRTETTLVLHSIQNSTFEVTKSLVEKGADIQKANSRGETPLLSAMRNQTYETAHYLISRGAYPGAQDQQGNTLLSYAIKAKKEDLALKAIASGIRLDTYMAYTVFNEEPKAHEYDIQRTTPVWRHYNYLHMAAAHGTTKVVKTLLEKGADISSPNRSVFDLDAAGFAALYGHTDTLKFLLASGASPYKRYTNTKPEGDMGLAYFGGLSSSYTLLSLAVISQNRSETMIDFLLNLPESNRYAQIETDPFYMNLMAMTRVGGASIFNKPLTKLRDWGFKNSHALDRKYEKKSPSRSDEKPVETKTAETLISGALKKGDLKQLRVIQNSGVNIGRVCPDAAFSADFFKQEHLILPLIDEFGIDINRTDSHAGKSTILNQLAIFYRHRQHITNTDLFAGLVERGLDINRAVNGETPLLSVIDNFHRDMDMGLIKAMLDHGADFGADTFALKKVYRVYGSDVYDLVAKNPMFKPAMERLYRNSDLAEVAIDVLEKRDSISRQPQYPERMENLLEVVYWNSYPLDYKKLADYAKKKKYDDLYRIILFYAGKDQTD